MNLNNFKRFATLQDVLQFLTRYVKYWRLAIYASVLGSVISLAYFVYGKPSYYSKSLIEYSYLDLPIRSEITDLTGRTRWDNILYRVVDGLQSKWLAERTALRLGLIHSVAETDTIWSRFINKVKINVSVANHLELEVWVYEPRLAKIWPEAMLAEYHDYLTETRIKHRDTLVDGFTKEMDRIKQNLSAEAERDRKIESDNHLLESYITNNKLEQLPSEMLTYRAQLDAMDEMDDFVEKSAPSVGEKLALLKKYRTMPLPTGTIVRRDTSPDPFIVKNTPSSVVPGQSGVSNTESNTSAVGARGSSNTTIVMPELSQKSELWEDIDTDLQAAKSEYEQLSSQLLPGHEKMRALQNKIDQLNFALNGEWEKSFVAFKLEKEHLKNKLEELQKQMPEYRKLIANYDDFRRDFRLQSSGRLAWEQAYTSMKGRLTAMEYTGPEVQVQFDHKGFIEVKDEIPVSPNKNKLLTYALALSLGLGLGLPVLTERLRFTSSFVAEAERLTQYPACGVVPLLFGLKHSANLLTLNGSNNPSAAHLVESFRIIRCALPLNAPPENKLQVIMVTSSRPNDGKTTVASLLAKSYAEAGDKTLIVDADLRRGSMHRVFSNNNDHLGLSEILDEGKNWNLGVRASEIINLDTICRGRAGSNSYDLLAGKKMADIVASMRTQYDRIIIDTPPLLGIADSQMIRKHVDGVLFVVRSDRTTQRDIATASEILHHNALPVYGFVMNGVDFSRVENSYYYGSYYSKYYEPTYYTALSKDNEVS